ncbi:MAG: hypothetical protein GX076_07500 [Clostridiales bacterium]|nr:hypothetical protein [Clostridiales bacterium]
MFSRRRIFWKRRWFLILVIALLCFGYLINQSTDLIKPNEESGKDAEVNKIVGETPSNEKSIQTVTDEKEETNIEKNEPYYLIKEENRVISIYYIDENGEKTFVRNTDINYDLLSNTDQSLFSNGIIKKSVEELEELLQDFGS